MRGNVQVNNQFIFRLILCICLGSRGCGSSYSTCDDDPNKPISTEIIVVIVVVVGIATLLFVCPFVVLLCICCCDCCRICQRLILACKRQLSRTSPVDVPTLSQANPQPMEPLDSRNFDLAVMPPSYQQATNNRQ